MTILFVFIAFVTSVVVLIEIRERRRKKTVSTDATEKIQSPSADCCGAHLVCEKDTLLNSSTEIIYYNDEELDQYKGRESNTYDENEISQFSEVLFTLKENEVAGWLRSLQLREIELPQQLRDEALMIVREQRNKTA